MASLTRWTWVSVNSGSWWWTGKPGVLWFMGLQRVGHNWATELKAFLSIIWVHPSMGFPGGSVIKWIHLPIQEMGVWFLVWEVPWRRKWQCTPVFLPGKSHGQGSLTGYSPWGWQKNRTWLNDSTTKACSKYKLSFVYPYLLFILKALWTQD